MTMRGQKSGTIFYGWWIVAVAGIALSVHAVPIVTFTFGIFLNAFSQEFNWSRGQASLAVSLSTLGIAVAVPFLGRLVDRFGARRVILPSTLLFDEIYGYTFAAVTLGAAVGPLVIGVSFDATGSYRLALLSFAVATFTAAGLMMGLGPYRGWEPVAEPVVATDILRVGRESASLDSAVHSAPCRRFP